MNRAPDFNELVGADLPADERERLRHAHELLVQAGPPPELPPSLEHVPDPDPKVTLLPQRRRYTAIGLAAALALTAFAAGDLAGGFRGSSFTAASVTAMHETARARAAHATIQLASIDGPATGR